MKNLIVSKNPARRSAKQKAASRRNIKKAQAARRSKSRRRVTRRRRNPSAKRSYVRRRSNQRRGFRLPTVNRILNDQVIPALWGGVGAVGNDMLINVIPLPAQWKTGWGRHVSKALGAVGIGVIAAMFLQKRTADQLGAGAMTVVGYNVVRDLAAQFMPQLPLGEYLEMPLGEYLDPSLGYYGAGLDPSTVPGSGMETAGQFTRGSPYMGDYNSVEAWPTGGAYDDLSVY